MIHPRISGSLGCDMSDVREIPEQIGELFELSKEYLRQETIEPVKKLGRAAGMGLLASLLFSLGAVLLAVAGMRLVVKALPDGELWSALGVFISVLVLAGVAGVIMWRASR
jgi:hypothetical protein